MASKYVLLYFCWKLHGLQGHLGAAYGTHKLVVWACREWKRWPGNFPECTLQWAVGNSRASNRSSLLRLDSWRQLTYYISTYVRAYQRCQLIQLNNQWKVALEVYVDRMLGTGSLCHRTGHQGNSAVGACLWCKCSIGPCLKDCL